MIARTDTQNAFWQSVDFGLDQQEFGCRINQISVDELFQKYEDLNFLYEAKMQRLAPYWQTVKQNWQRAMDTGRELMDVCTFEEAATGAWAASLIGGPLVWVAGANTW